MKKTYRIICAVLTLCLLSALFAGCGNNQDAGEPSESVTTSQTPEISTPAAPSDSADPEPDADPLAVALPLVDETATFSLWTVIFPNMTSYTEDFSESYSFAVLEEKTNIHIAVNAVSFFSATENLTMLIAADDLFDLTAGLANFYSGGVNAVHSNGMIVDILEYADCMPNYLNVINSDESIARDAINDDGKLPYVYQISDAVTYTQGPVVRTDWLEKIGWSADRLVTYDDWHTVLKAFQTELGVSNPLWLAYTGGTPTSGLGGGFGISNSESQDSGAPSYIYQVGGEVKFAPYEDGFYDWLELASTWYAEGLIDPDFINGNNTGAPDNANLGASKYGIWWCSTTTMSNIFDVNEDEGLAISGITEPVLSAGEKYHFVAGRSSYVTVNGVAVASKCADIELLCRYLDYHYTGEGSIIAKYGQKGITFDYNSAGEPELTDFLINNPDGIPKNTAISLYTANVGAGINFLELTLAGFNRECQAEAVEIWTAQQGESWDFPNYASMTEDEGSEYSALWNDISTYIQEYTLSVITNGIALESSYDGFLAGLGNMDVERCIGIKQAALDRYNSR